MAGYAAEIFHTKYKKVFNLLIIRLNFILKKKMDNEVKLNIEK